MRVGVNGRGLEAYVTCMSTVGGGSPLQEPSSDLRGLRRDVFDAGLEALPTRRRLAPAPIESRATAG